MAAKTTPRCRKISKIADTLTDNAIKLYDEGKMVAFWDTVNALDILTDVQSKVCNLE